MMNCNQCNLEMAEAELISQPVPGIGPYVHIKGKYGDKKTSAVTCYVCKACGKIELRATDLNIFK